MSNELAETQQNDLAALQQQAGALTKDEDFKELSKVGDYIPRFQLCGSNSTLFKKNKIEKCHYAIVYTADNFLDLGKTPIVFPLAWRACAVDMSEETPVSVYDQNSEAFKNIQAQAGVKDSQCVYGPQFLIYVPEAKACATFLFGSKTARTEAPNFRNLLDKKVTIQLNHRIIEGKGKNTHIWEAIKCEESVAEFNREEMIPVATKALKKFIEEQKKKAPETSSTEEEDR